MNTRMGRRNQQINNKLYEQLFDVLPRVSAWYWGHEHRLTFYKFNAYGIACGRMLGNSSFQVNTPTTYKVKYNKNKITIPELIPDLGKTTYSKGYFDHTGAVMTHNA